MLAFLILLPLVLIILQRETGSALVYTAFFLMLYREGMPGVVLFPVFALWYILWWESVLTRFL